MPGRRRNRTGWYTHLYYSFRTYPFYFGNRNILLLLLRGWTGGIRGAGNGGKGGGDGGRGGLWKFLGRGYTKICCILPILLYFYVLQCNNWVSEVSNRHIKVNSGIFAMNPALISLYRRGVFRQP